MRLTILGILLLLVSQSISAAINPPRFHFIMRDRHGAKFVVNIMTHNEKVSITAEDGVDSGAALGDRVASGKYSITLQASSWPAAKVQKVAVFGAEGNAGAFNLEHQMAYLVPGKKTHADILCIEQNADSSNNIIYPFYIDNNMVKPISIQWADWCYHDSETNEKWDKSHRLHYDANNRLTCAGYLQGLAFYRKLTWDFNEKMGRLLLWNHVLLWPDVESKKNITCGFVEDGVEMLPLIDLCEALGYKIQDNAQQNQYLILSGKTKIVYPVGAKQILINNQRVTPAHADTVFENTLYVPVSTLKQLFNLRTEKITIKEQAGIKVLASNGKNYTAVILPDIHHIE